MKLNITNFCLGLAIFSLAACNDKSYTQIENGVEVRVKSSQENSAKIVRVSAMNDKIFRVQASNQDQMPSTNSLCVNMQTSKVDVNISEQENLVKVSTKEVIANINTMDGQVVFTDVNGNPILSEESNSHKFNSVYCDSLKDEGYYIEQVWQSANDEALFGLGQHQSNEWNYKGKNEELFQYNTKISLPFIISNKNYGILWDNYSLSRFGNPNEFLQINQAFKVYDAEGKEGGLSSTWTAQDKSVEVLKRIEPILYFENLKANREMLPKNFPLDESFVTFEGEIEPMVSGMHKFILYYAGYVKVFFDGENITPDNDEIWRTAWNPNARKFDYTFEKGKKVKVRIEWKPDGGESYCGLRVHQPYENQDKITFSSEIADKIDYYFIKGENIDDVISGYRSLTGKAQVMPKWALGFWQSRERYKTQDEILGALKGFRDRHIPIDNIVMDWNYWPEDQWGSHEFDPERFQDPKQMIDQIHQMQARILISVWPKFYHNTDHYKEFDSKGMMYLQAVKDSIRDWVGPGYVGSFYDAYNPEARKMFWNQMSEHLFKLGIDCWWMDASEPNVRDCTDMDYRKQLCGPTYLGSSAKYFNAYALVNAMAIYDGQRSEKPNQRVFLLTRSGFLGLQRYSTASWSGDIATRWEDMRTQISAGLNFSISGIPYWTQDIGGFCVEKRYAKAQGEYDKTGKVNQDLVEWRELQTRWYQFGTFCPLYRAHGQFPFREVYNIDKEGTPTYNSILYYNKLRYRLMPYIYSLAGMVNREDYTIMRPLVMDFAQDKKAIEISDQYMFGPALMVCPVYQYKATKKDVYLPQCEGWYNFYSGEFVRAGQTISADAPYEKMPLFVKAGSIVTYGKEIENTQEDKGDELTICVYQGKDCKFTIYEDEGTNYDYEQGKSVTIELSYNEESKTLTIGDAKGSFDGYVANKKINVIYFTQDTPKALDLNKVDKTIEYNGQMQTINLQ